VWRVSDGYPGAQVTGTLSLDNGGPGGPATDAYAPIDLSRSFVADASVRDAVSPLSSAEGRFLTKVRSQAPSWAPTVLSGDVSSVVGQAHCHEVIAPNPFGEGRVECDWGDAGWNLQVNFVRLDGGPR
jgi:hypothetical protein